MNHLHTFTVTHVGYLGTIYFSCSAVRWFYIVIRATPVEFNPCLNNALQLIEE